MTPQAKAYIYALTAILMWSTVATAFKLTLAELDILSLILGASITSTLVLGGALVVRGELAAAVQVAQRYWLRSTLSGAVNPAIYYLVLLSAYDRLPAQLAQPINYTWAIILTLLSALVLRQPITRHDFIAAAVCYAGVICIVSQGGDANAQVDLTGITLALASTIIWALYWLANMRDPRPPAIAMFLNFSFALPLLACAWWAFADVRVSWAGFAGAAYIGVFEMGLAFLAWSAALRLSSNSSWISNLIFLSPFISLGLISLILGERIYPTTYAGLGLIVGGLLYQQWRKATPHA